MNVPFEYRRNFTKGALENIEKRKEIYDKHGQHIAVTLSPVAGDKLPLFVKLPCLSSYFRLFPEETGYQNHSEGLFNGIYYLPQKVTHKKLPIRSTASKRYLGRTGTDMASEIKTTDKFDLLRRAYQDVARNVMVSSQRKVIMKDPSDQHNYRTDKNLIANGNYISISLYISLISIFIHINN